MACVLCLFACLLPASPSTEGVAEIKTASHALIVAQLRCDAASVARLLTQISSTLATTERSSAEPGSCRRQPISSSDRSSYWNGISFRFDFTGIAPWPSTRSMRKVSSATSHTNSGAILWPPGCSRMVDGSAPRSMTDSARSTPFRETTARRPAP